ncbi:hypothetical protein [Sphingomonas sp. IC4-52]|uniref:tetratricopeptide repeat protein n=1 Tax=Sphingomonas sp. IC4-52 TaxID=2887202 RepID=UPI001D11B1E2|nr:hypothetical protein [Sphingomonas sp. IC4-52]MCC2978890.1 hypothetical protein [Sphingomonas sp. IC4-52]
MAKLLLGIEAPVQDTSPSELFTQPDELHASVRRLKQRLVEHPRDAIAGAELARFYLLLGQPTSALAAMERAVSNAPDNRFVLRSAAQLFATTSEPQRGLDLLWRSDAVRSDPWVQAAEVALADLVGRGPRYGSKKLASLLATDAIGISYSELSAGLASLEWKSGVKRSKVKKLLQKSIRSPTENALAQAVWLENESDISVSTDNLIANNGSAYEARSRANYEAGNYAGSSEAALHWLNDQPFSLDAARDYVFVTSVHLSQFSKSIEVAEAAARLHPRDFNLINGLLYSLVMDGRHQRAREARVKLRQIRSSGDQLPFLHAADGLLAFSDGNIEEGRQCYLRAMTSAREVKRPNLVINAGIYWLEQETLSGSMGKADILENIGDLDKAIAESAKNVSVDASPTWKSKRQHILDLLYKRESKVTRQIEIGDGKKVSYTISAKHLTAAMRDK